MHISYSMVNVAKQCWRKYYWKYVDGLEPIDQGPHLKLGSIIHDAFYSYYSGASSDEIVQFIDDRFDEEISKVEPPDVENLTLLHATARGMWDSFPKDLKTFQSILPEHPFVINFNGMPIEGRLDGLVQKDGKFWVRELKTTSLSQRQFRERMNISEQATLYFWAARKMGFPVEGIVYDALHKPMLRKQQSEDAKSFALRIRLDYKNRPDFYYQREYVFKTPVDIDHFEEDMAFFQRELVSKHNDNDPRSFYRNHNSCINFNSECAYRKICFGQKPDELTLKLFYQRRENANTRGTSTGSAGNGS